MTFRTADQESMLGWPILSTLRSLNAKWFWCCVFCVACCVPWIFLSKLGGDEIPPRTMQYLFNIGGIPVGAFFLATRRLRIEKSVKGIFYGLMVGVVCAVGQLALFSSYRGGANTSVVTVVTSLYPLVTVMLAVFLLRERLSKAQIVGVGFAVASFVIFSF